MFNFRWPPFSAALILELHEKNENDYLRVSPELVRIKHRLKRKLKNTCQLDIIIISIISISIIQRNYLTGFI